MKHSHRGNDKFGFIILDIDDFKKVNDTFGHDIGDNVLIKLGNCLKKMMREDDVLARWGGEEFVLITKNEKVKSLIQIIEKIQNSLCSLSFEPVEKITLSFGVTLYKAGDTKESILKRADIALYRAKQNGKNRFELEF